MDRHQLIISVILFVLAGCQKDIQPVSNAMNGKSGFLNYRNTRFQYSIDVPKESYASPRSATGVAVGFINYDHWLSPPSSTGYLIGMNALTEPCSPSLTGASKTEPLAITNVKSEWGKVDFFDIHGWDYLPEEAPKCRPPGSGTAYALCSEHNGKTVLICISQITDNPALAEQIFRTFRWTE